MKIAIIIARVLLGGIFLVFGINGFVGFLEVPPLEGDAGTFMGILFSSGWLYVVKVLEIVGGIMVLAGRFLPLGLVLLGPIVVNILLFHLLLAPSGMVMAIVLVVLEAFLIWAHKARFLTVLTP